VFVLGCGESVVDVGRCMKSDPGVLVIMVVVGDESVNIALGVD
jgi:hypothetical protein